MSYYNNKWNIIRYDCIFWQIDINIVHLKLSDLNKRRNTIYSIFSLYVGSLHYPYLPNMKRTLLILTLLLSGSVRDTTLDSGVERKVVVEFVLTEDGVQNLYLSLTREPGELVSPIIQEADIKLIHVSQQYETEHRFIKAADNLWTLDYSGIPGDEYRLEVRVDGYDLVWAEQEMPDKVEWIRAAIGHGNTPKYASYGHFYYVDGMPEYLIVRGIKRNKETGEYGPVEVLCTDYPGVEEINATGLFYDGNPKWRSGEGERWTEIGWQGSPYVYHDSPVYGMEGVWTYMFPNLIGKPLYKDFLFITRVNDNHAGLDALYSFSSGYDDVSQEEYRNAKAFCISGSFYMNQAYYDSGHHLIDYDEYLLFTSISPDYGRFLKDAWQFKKVRECGDLSSIYLRDNIHSNLQGGLGVFGAMVSVRTDFDGENVDLESIPETEL